MKYKLRVKTLNELGYLENLLTFAGVTFAYDMHNFCGLVFYTWETWVDPRSMDTYYEIEGWSFAPEWVEVLEIIEE